MNAKYRRVTRKRRKRRTVYHFVNICFPRSSSYMVLIFFHDALISLSVLMTFFFPWKNKILMFSDIKSPGDPKFMEAFGKLPIYYYYRLVFLYIVSYIISLSVFCLLILSSFFNFLGYVYVSGLHFAFSGWKDSKWFHDEHYYDTDANIFLQSWVQRSPRMFFLRRYSFSFFASHSVRMSSWNLFNMNGNP